RSHFVLAPHAPSGREVARRAWGPLGYAQRVPPLALRARASRPFGARGRASRVGASGLRTTSPPDRTSCSRLTPLRGERSRVARGGLWATHNESTRSHFVLAPHAPSGREV